MSRIAKLAGLCLFVLFGTLLTTNPRTLPSVVLILPFILVFTIVFLFLVYVGIDRGMAHGKTARIAVFGASLPTLILVLQSLGQLTLRDVLTILVLFCIAYFYMTRVASSRQVDR